MATESAVAARARPAPNRRQLFALAAALAATALTAAAAIAGLTRTAPPAPAPVQTVNQVITPTGTIRHEPVEPGG